MKKQVCCAFIPFFCIFSLLQSVLNLGRICMPSGKIEGKRPPSGCNNTRHFECCEDGKYYSTYKCLLTISSSGRTKAILTVKSFESNSDGGVPCECGHKFYLEDDPVVALSTRWYNGGSRCLKYINIYGNGKSVKAKVVDECDSTVGCDADQNISLHAVTILSTLQKPFGKAWECLKNTGVKWISTGLMLDLS